MKKKYLYYYLVSCILLWFPLFYVNNHEFEDLKKSQFAVVLGTLTELAIISFCYVKWWHFYF